MMTSRQLTRLAALALAGSLVAACGGGGGGGDSADALDGVPERAKASAAGFTSYVGELPGKDADSREPFAIDDFTPPTSDDTEPKAVDG